jgi:hypothetical protein
LLQSTEIAERYLGMGARANGDPERGNQLALRLRELLKLSC